MILRAELELMFLGSGTAFDTNKSLAINNQDQLFASNTVAHLTSQVILNETSNWKLFDQSSYSTEQSDEKLGK